MIVVQLRFFCLNLVSEYKQNQTERKNMFGYTVETLIDKKN